ncbi:MAG: NAD-dependent deacetylase [Candidatus Glassbacteria bacterium]
MTVIIDDTSQEELLREVARRLSSTEKAIAITGAGISVESGIPDFRSPGGLWERFDPMEYAYIDTFLKNPDKSWQLFREIGRTLDGKVPNPAHYALAELEERKIIHAVITQNVDGLHQRAGSKNVIEVHGDHSHLECIRCRTVIPVEEEHIHREYVPRCQNCGFQLKPAVVLFGEAIKAVDEIEKALNGCDALLVAGTSAQVHPVASFPWTIKSRGGIVIEANLTHTALTGSCSDYLIKGSASTSLSKLVQVIDEL